MLFLLGFVYSALSPDFGLNSQTLVLFVSLVVALGFLTYFSEGSTTRLAHRRYRADASVRLYGTVILVSILAVVVSRLVTFQPGLVYGFVASAVIVAPVALNRRDDATLVLVPALGLLVVSVLAWLLLGPIRVAAADGALRARPCRDDPGDDRHRWPRDPVRVDDPVALHGRRHGHGLEPARRGRSRSGR